MVLGCDAVLHWIFSKQDRQFSDKLEACQSFSRDAVLLVGSGRDFHGLGEDPGEVVSI